jgi:heat shock protein HslJ
MKYLLLLFTISIMSCGDRATDTNAQSSTAAPTASQQTPAAQNVPGSQSPLTGTYWKLIELNQNNIEGKTAKEMYLLLDPSSPQFKSHSGCNLVMGEAKRGGTNQMWFINLLPTTSPCTTPDIDVEFQKALEAVTDYTQNGNILLLNKKGGVPVMKFMAKG